MSIGIAVMAIVTVSTLCAVMSVAMSMRTPGSATTPYAATTLVEPFRGATAGFATLGSRDSARATLAAGATLPRDPGTARSLLETALRDRGYVQGATPELATRALPFDAAASDLEGACGVVMIVGDVATTLTGAGIVGGTTFRTPDPSVFTVASCGATTVHVEGAGSATLRTWLMPGLTPTAPSDTGLTPDALLAHAEMEVVLRRRGYAPVDEIVEVTPTATTAGGFVTVRMPVTPTAGCIPFAVYAEGAGRPQITPGRFDYLEDRGVVGAIACASSGTGWDPTFVDDATVGARVFVRAYAASTPPGTAAISIGAAHVVDAAHASWPAAISQQ